MEINNEFRRIRSNSESLPLATELLIEQSRYDQLNPFLDYALPRIAETCSAATVVLVQATRGNWTRLRSFPEKAESPPATLLSSVLDTDEIKRESAWIATPLVQRSSENEILAIRSGRASPNTPLAGREDSLAAALGLAVARLRHRRRLNRRIGRLEAILEIAGQWSRNLDMESLLTQMAETSTRLFGAERASIFLWDKVNRTLVGRPALGVNQNELRIPDDSGIVGSVVRTGEVLRVDENAPGELINRDVDRQLGFRTRTLLCAPLKGQNGTILGAFELINKRDGAFTDDDEVGLIELAGHAAIALETTQQFRQLLESRKQIAQQAAEGIELIGDTPAIRKLRATIERVARTDLALLVLGENGTGKEVVSRLVHYSSDRRHEPFIAVNCAALTETLLESELFGHEKGAFTDAHEARAGKFELASGGTLFLDEIGDLSLSGQAKLLRVLEERVVVRVGGSIPIPADTRVIAATNQNLSEMVRSRRFREDLYFRLNVVTIDLPPLRERADDIVLLAEHFLHDFSAKARRRVPKFSAAAIKRLRQHPWPGNVRELRNLMERLAYLSQSDIIDADELAFIMSPKADMWANLSMEQTLAEATRRFQIDYIRKQIELAGGSMTDAAIRLGLHRSNLYRKMRQLEMEDSFEEE
jgi:Nif-specific regulatory protein